MKTRRDSLCRPMRAVLFAGALFAAGAAVLPAAQAQTFKYEVGLSLAYYFDW